MSERTYPKQGQIIYINFSPAAGHEIVKRRPADVVSNDILMQTSHFVWIVPISHGSYDGPEYPLHVALDERTKISGTVYTEQLKSFDFIARKWQYIEDMPHDILTQVIQKLQLAVTLPEQKDISK